MSDSKDKNVGCFGCFSVVVSLLGIVFLAHHCWFYFTGQMIMWCQETPNGPIAHYSDGHRALCKACFKGEDSDGATSWAAEGCVPIVEPIKNLAPTDSEHDSNPDTEI